MPDEQTYQFPLSFALLIASTSLGLVPVVTGGCKPSSDSSDVSTSESAPLIWDFTQSQHVSRADWPQDAKSDIWLIDRPGTVELAVASDKRSIYKFAKAQLRRSEDKIVVVQLVFPSESFDRAYQRAKMLAAEYDVTDVARLDDWYERNGRSSGGGVATVSEGVSRYTPDQTITITARHTYDRQHPWCVAFSYGFPQNEPTTAQTDELNKDGG